MFGWRRKSDGFVWREYVRTTILVRRQKRRQKAANVRDAAIDGLKHAGRQGIALGTAGASAAGRGISSGLVTAYHVVADAVTVGATASLLWLADRSGPFGEAVRDGAGRLVEATGQPAVSTPLLLTGAVATLSAAARWNSYGFDGNATLAAVIAAAALLLYALPYLADLASGQAIGQFAGRLPFAHRVRPEVGSALGAGAMLIAAIAGLSWLVPALSSGSTAIPGVATSSPALTPVSGRIEGKAVALAGDQLRVGGTHVRFYGVEAPERGQTCTGAGSKGATASCASNAKSALQKLVTGKQVTCDISGQAAGNVSSATCQINGADLAGQLVRGGHVFATTGLFATYASAEREARTARAGLWRAGEPLRPADFRAKVWADAKQAAPDGCPIKGVVNGEAKSYVLPWYAGYDKAKIRSTRGERWFCTEDEARAAGWKAAEPS